MPKLKPGIRYAALSSRANGIPRDIRSGVKVRLPVAIPAGSHEWIETEALWDTGATNSVISSSLAIRLNLPAVSRATTYGIHGPKEVDVFLIDFLLMNAVHFPSWRVSSGDTGPTTPDVIIGMDIITRGDMTFMAGGGEYIFSFIVPSLEDPTDFNMYVTKYNDDLKWKTQNAQSQAEYRAKLKSKKPR